MTNYAPPEVALDPQIDPIIREVSVAPDGLSARFLGADLEGTTHGGLAMQIAGLIYRRFHAGMVPDTDEPSNILLREDVDLEGRILAATARTERFESLRVIENLPQFGGAILVLQGIRVFVPNDRIVSRTGTLARTQLNSTATRLSLGFLFYTSRMGGGHSHRPLRLYRKCVHSDEAVAVWSRLTEWAEEHAIRVRAKVLSRSSDFPRNDALVVYLPSESWHHHRTIAALMENDDPWAATSPLTRRVASGVSLAWEPDDPSPQSRGMSFGEHRSQLIATGIVAGAGDLNRARSAVRLGLLVANVDPLDVSQNLDSPVLT